MTPITLRQRRLESQLLLSLIAAFSVTALSILLILDAVHTAEGIVVTDARETLAGVLDQLARQYGDRVNTDPNWASLPSEAQDLSLRSVARIVFAAYPEVDGGYVLQGPSPDEAMPIEAAKATAGGAATVVQRGIERVVTSAIANGAASLRVADSRDLVIFEARRVGAGAVAWAFKRLPGRNARFVGQREALLAVLALAGLFSVTGVIATGVRLRQGIREIQRGLIALESDFSYLLPERDDELGWISGSINRMASARRALEAERAREQRLRSMAKLVAGVAHEIRNPLNSIRLAMEMIGRRLERQTLRRDDLEMVCSEVDRLNHLLTGLLTFDQTTAPRRARQAVAPVVEHCLRLLQPQAEERRIVLTARVCDRTLEAVFDTERLMQAVVNLILNAIEATAPGGGVEVSIGRAGGLIRVAVHDHGPGLTEEQQERLFEAFYTTKENGTGLGLAVSRELVTSMGGSLTYEDGRPGARFVIDIPAEAGCHA